MKKASPSMMRKWMWRTLAVCIGTAVFPVLPASGQWYVEMGPAYRRDMQISVQGGSRAAENGVGWDWTRIGVSGSRPSAKDSLLNDDGSQAVLRVFDDGFVGPSGWAWARDAGVTQFWGYESDSQYDSDADTLTYRLTLTDTQTSSRSETLERLEARGWSDSKRTDGVGVLATVGYMLGRDGAYPWGVQMRLGWLDGMRGNFRNREAARFNRRSNGYQATLDQQEIYGYEYDTLGNPAFPDAPYVMNDPEGVGPMIADRPTSIEKLEEQEDLTESRTWRKEGILRSHADLKVDAQAFFLQAGPRLLWNISQQASLMIQPSLSLNLIDADARRVETLRDGGGRVQAQWADRADDQAWRMGAGIQAGAIVDLSERWYLVLSAGYDWVDKWNLDVGPDRVSIDLSGYQYEFAVGLSF